MIYSKATLRKQFRAEKDDFRLKADQCILESADGTTAWYLLYYKDTRFKAFDLLTRKETHEKVQAYEINFRSPKVGYVNCHDGEALFLVREPIRRWTIGLTSHNLRVHNHPVDLNHDHLLWRKLLLHSDLGKAILNKYPSFREAKSLLDQKRATSVAFHRNFALSNRNGFTTLDNMGTSIGTFIDDDLRLISPYNTPAMEQHLSSVGVQ